MSMMANTKGDTLFTVGNGGDDNADSSDVSSLLLTPSTPESTPSRRSARKKQSTFSNDFEYYTPTVKKKGDETEFKPGFCGTPIESQTDTEQEEPLVDIEDEGKEEVEAEKRMPMKRKIAVKRGKRYLGRNVESGHGGDEESETGMGSTKVAARKIGTKVVASKGRLPTKKGKDVPDDDDDESAELGNDELASKKITRGGTAKGRSVTQRKSLKQNTEDDFNLSLKQTRSRKRKNVEEVEEKNEKKGKGQHEESSPIDNDGDICTSTSQQKRAGRKMLTAVISPLAQNLMKNIIEISSDSASDVSPVARPKRKLGVADKGIAEQTPAKVVKGGRGGKLTPASGKRVLPADLGLIRRSPSEIAARVGAVQKVAQTNGVTATEQATTASLLEVSSESSVKEEDVKTEPASNPSEDNKTPDMLTVKTEPEKANHKDEIGKTNTEKNQNVKKMIKKELKSKKELKDIKNKSKVLTSKKKAEFSDKQVLKTEKKHLKTQELDKKGEEKHLKTQELDKGEEKHLKTQELDVKTEEKMSENLDKKKEAIHDIKAPEKIPTGNIKSKKITGKSTTGVQSAALHKKIQDKPPKSPKKDLKKINPESSKKQDIHNLNPEGFRKRDIHNVDDLLRRGIFHKKKSHQPFGNRITMKHHGKDMKQQALSKNIGTKQDQPVNKGAFKKVEGKATERGKSIKETKLERRHSNSSSKRGRRKSGEDGKKSDIPVSGNGAKNGMVEELPTLTPIAVLNKSKHKHHKSDHDVPLDMTMMDLFKPDGVVIHDQQKKDGTSKPGQSGGKSQYVMDVYDSSSFIKPENLHHVLIEHQYSKSSPMEKSDSHTSDGGNIVPSRDDDIESVSHKQAVFMDMDLPDQILEEEPAIEENTSNVVESCVDHSLSKKEVGCRSSILESLHTEIKESGTEFRIVGQVELGKNMQMYKDTSRSKTQVSTEPTHDGLLMERLKESEPKRASVDTAMRASVDTAKRAGVDTVKKTSVDTAKRASVDTTKRASVDTAKKASVDTAKRASIESRRDSSDVLKSSASDKKETKDRTKSMSENVEKRKRKGKEGKAGNEHGHGKGEEEEDGDSDGHEFEDDHGDLDWEPNNADTVYCICRKPHNNRFMICCDKCEEWFHGSCVGITTARGKEMEDREEEYICPVCSKGGDTSSLDKTPKTAEMIVTKPKTQPQLQKCIGRKCLRPPRSGSIYCSNECIMTHAQESLKAIREDHMQRKIKEKDLSFGDGSKSSSTKGVSSPSVDTVEVIERQTGKVVRGSSAPTPKGLHRWLEQHPTYEVVLPHSRHRSKSSFTKDDKNKKSDHEHKSTDHDRRPSTDKDKKSEYDHKTSDKDRRPSADKDKKSDHDDRSRHSSASSKDSGKRSDNERRNSTSQRSDTSSTNSKLPDKKDDGPNQIRINVRTALRDCLSARAQEAEDIMLSSNEIKNLAVTIEDQLFSLFNDTGHKYRTKYRSLVFNIKDQKNKGLFRKILSGKIKPGKLVQMSTEELASRELAKWREQATKHELEMIEKTEQEAMKESETTKHVIKKTHKGEVEVEEEDLSILEAHIEERKDPEPESQEDQSQTSAVDTTHQHRAHLFDLNCKVCTGKIVPGPEEQAAMATVTEKTPVVTEDNLQSEKIDLETAEEIVKEALMAVQRVEQSVLSMPKMLTSSPMTEETPPPPLSPLMSTPGRESSSSASSTSSISLKKSVVVRSPDSALQSGLESKPKFTPTGPLLWKGFVSMLDVAKFFTSAYRVSGPTDHVIVPDTIHILGRISPDHMWDYLSRMRQSGSKDLTVIRFIPGSDDEKVAYVHLYSYLNSRSRCGVAGNPNKKIKDFYIVPLASHSKIPRTLLPFDGPGLEENRPHMLIGIMVRQRGKHGSDVSDASSTGSDKPGSQSSAESRRSVTGHSRSGSSKSGSHSRSSKSIGRVSGTKASPAVNRDPRLAKKAAREAENQPRMSPVESSSSGTSITGEAQANNSQETEYVPLPIQQKNTNSPIVEYVPTPTDRHKNKAKKRLEKNSEETSERDSGEEDDKHQHHHRHHHHHHHHHHKKVEVENNIEDDSEPYSPGKEAEPYSPSQEAAADEPYDPADENLMDDSVDLIVSSAEISSSTTYSGQASETVAATIAVEAVCDEGVAEQPSSSVPVLVHGDVGYDISELVEKMACSNDPNEISSLMVTALSTASSSLEQQKLLVELTKRVEDRKLQLAEIARQAALNVSTSESARQTALNVSTSETARQTLSHSGYTVDDNTCLATDTSSSLVIASNADTSGISSVLSINVDVSINAQEGVGSAPQWNLSGDTPDPTVSSASLSNSNAQSSDSLIDLTSKEETISNKQLLTDSCSTSSSAISFHSTKESKDAGIVKFSFNKSRTKTQQSLQKSTPEVLSSEKVEPKPKVQVLYKTGMLSNKPTKPDSTKSDQLQTSVESHHHSDTSPSYLDVVKSDTISSSQASLLEHKGKMLLDAITEQMPVNTTKEDRILAHIKFLNEHAEAQKRLKDEDEARKILDSIKNSQASVGEGIAADLSTAVFDVKPNVENSNQSHAGTPPSIDELLERLKKGGFQFQKSEANISLFLEQESTLTSTLPSPQTRLNSVSTGESSLSLPPQTSSVMSSTLSSVEDVDLRHRNDLTHLPAATNSSPSLATSNSDFRVTDFGDHDERLIHDRQDSAIYPPLPTSAPKYSIDQVSLPPLPSGYPPHPPSVPPNMPNPQHRLDHLQMPTSDTSVSYISTVRGAPHHDRFQHPPSSGPDFDQPTAVANFDPNSDVDMRNLSIPTDQIPLPSYPPPPSRGHFSLRDVDYRNVDTFRPQQSYPGHGPGDYEH